ncbi:MAG TPA: zf-HC2 domain-containing protein [Gemmatimonadaceae bacterium]|nr:zf-HC2 domain-containing protein [Gemmatimonadaceae bacterium]
MTGESSSITCEVFSQRLMDFLEGDLDGAPRNALEAHARQCAACGALLADLRRLSAEASRLPTLTPSRDLWGSGIAARIEAPVVPLAPRRLSWRSPRIVTAGLAAALVLAAALGYETARRGAPQPGAPSASAGPVMQQPVPDVRRPVDGAAAPAPSRGAVLAANRAADATPAAVQESYDSEISGLRAILDARRSQLDTTTVAVIEKNLAVIDSAIVQCRAALTKDPASRYLMRSLSQSLDTKVQLLRIAAGLPAST